MKFIFPQNYDFSHKLLGFIEYTTLFLNLFWAGIVYLFSLIFSSYTPLQVAVFIILFLPVLLFSIIGFNHEKMVYILKYIFTFVFLPKCYLYHKNL